MTSDAWIAVADALPAEAGYYLVYSPSNDPDRHLFMIVSDYAPGTGFAVRYMLDGPITHWMPLPEPPSP